MDILDVILVNFSERIDFLGIRGNHSICEQDGVTSVIIFNVMMKKYKRILLVDDDDTSNLLTTMVIADMNITEEVDVALNGEEALKYMINNCAQGAGNDQQNCPGLILLDINMPIMDGFEFLEAYKQKFDTHNKIPVVMLSSSSNRKDFDKAKAFKVKGYIVKPLNEEKLQEALASS